MLGPFSHTSLCALVVSRQHHAANIGAVKAQATEKQRRDVFDEFVTRDGQWPPLPPPLPSESEESGGQEEVESSDGGMEEVTPRSCLKRNGPNGPSTARAGVKRTRFRLSHKEGNGKEPKGGVKAAIAAALVAERASVEALAVAAALAAVEAAAVAEALVVERASVEAKADSAFKEEPPEEVTSPGQLDMQQAVASALAVERASVKAASKAKHSAKPKADGQLDVLKAVAAALAQERASVKAAAKHKTELARAEEQALTQERASVQGGNPESESDSESGMDSPERSRHLRGWGRRCRDTARSNARKQRFWKQRAKVYKSKFRKERIRNSMDAERRAADTVNLRNAALTADRTVMDMCSD